MTSEPGRAMAHRPGPWDRFAGPGRRAARAAGRDARRAIPRVLAGRPGRLQLGAVLLVAVVSLILATGSAGRDHAALAATTPGPAVEAHPSPPLGAASALDSLTGTAGIDPLDLIAKGVIVAALLYLTLRALRRLQAGPGAGSHRLQVIETRPLGPKASLHLVSVGDRRLVIGLSPGGIVSLAELDAAELAEPGRANLGPGLASPDGDLPHAAGAGQVDVRTAAAAAWVALRQRLAAPVAPRLAARTPATIAIEGDER